MNPTQFGPNEDLSLSQDLPQDLRICRAEGVDAVFLPSDAVMYPGRESGTYSTYVVEERLSSGMEEGPPTHFRGVTTVVAQLLIPSCRTWRFWGQGLATGSGNPSNDSRPYFPDSNRGCTHPPGTRRTRDGFPQCVTLDPEQRARATVLSRALKECRRRVARRRIPAAQLPGEIGAMISACPAARLDYVGF